MNKRIQELAEQAYGIDDSKPFHPSALVALEKFAELIVNECADWIDSNVGMIDEDARRDLLNHFGVE